MLYLIVIIIGIKISIFILLFSAMKEYRPAPFEYKVELLYPIADRLYPLQRPLAWGDFLYILIKHIDGRNADSFDVGYELC